MRRSPEGRRLERIARRERRLLPGWACAGAHDHRCPVCVTLRAPYLSTEKARRPAGLFRSCTGPRTPGPPDPLIAFFPCANDMADCGRKRKPRSMFVRQSREFAGNYGVCEAKSTFKRFFGIKSASLFSFPSTNSRYIDADDSWIRLSRGLMDIGPWLAFRQAGLPRRSCSKAAACGYQGLKRRGIISEKKNIY